MECKPILFNTPMVQTILDGRKTVTRRVIKPQPNFVLRKMTEGAHKDEWHEYSKNPLCDPMCKSPWGCKYPAPYNPGDILWMRETWQKWASEYHYKADYNTDRDMMWTQAESCPKWRPSIHMPKEAARIFLSVTDVRVERLQYITIEQAKAEGAYEGPLIDGNDYIIGARYSFIELWDSTIPKKDIDLYGWDANPWVWVIEFERCEKPEGWCQL